MIREVVMAKRKEDVQDMFSQMAVRTVIEEVWKLIEEGEKDPVVCRSALSIAEAEIAKAKMTDSAYIAAARDWAQKWHQRTGACPKCGEKGDLHA